MVPHATYAPEADRELTAIVEEYNKSSPEQAVELVWRGENFSSIKNLVTLQLAGDLPEIASVEPSELAALEKMKITQPIRLPGKEFSGARASLPFRTTVPLLFSDKEALTKARMDLKKVTGRWETFSNSVQDVANQSLGSDRYALALPLQGPMGLWIFEALVSRPLWTREAGGLKSNRDLYKPIRALQKLLGGPGVASPNETWERSLQAFMDRKVPLLVGSLDVMPYIAKHASFEWEASLLPSTQDAAALLEGGSHLVITQDSEGVRKFLRFLYSSEIGVRWSAAGHYLPAQPSWLQSPAGKKMLKEQPRYAAFLTKVKKTSPRSTDVEVIRARSEWIQSLRILFGDPAHRASWTELAPQMDSRLALTQ